MAEAPRPPTICILTTEHLANEYIGPLTRGAMVAAGDFGCRLLLYSPLAIHLAHRVIPLDNLPLLPPGADGYLMAAYVTDEVPAFCARAGAAVLIFAGTLPGLPSIVPDNRAGARAATAHLIAHGRRRIVHLAGAGDSTEARERLAGYRDALADAELPYDEALVVPGEFQILPAEAAVERLLRDGVAFDAVFAANDMSARGAIGALARAGLRVPGDIVVAGFDDSLPAATMEPPLTTVRQSAFAIGYEAVRLLAARQRGKPLPQHTVIPTQLVVRESCGCPPDARDATGADEQLAISLGTTQGPLIAPALLAAWSQPLDVALAGDGGARSALRGALAQAERMGWHVLAMRDYLRVWQVRRLAADDDAARVAVRVAQALDALSAWIDRRQQEQQIARARRINAAAYVTDMLREYGDDQSTEAALHYIVSTGPRQALSVQRGASADTLSAQLVVAEAGTQRWQGPAAHFPPAEWVAAGDTLLLMPMGTGQQLLLGIIERDEQEYVDLDDLLLRAINTYRSITVLHETLRELDAARSVQLSLLPRQAPQTADYDIAGATRTARQVGGDLYGYYVCPSGSLALALGDVAGKGMPAALLMSACVTALAGTIPAGLAPSLTLSQIHQVLHPSVGRGQNAAVCLAYLEGPRVRIANAGAVAPLLRTATGVRLIEVGGLPLGTALSAQLPYREVEERLAPGDMLVLSSDGIVEAMNECGELYGFERFADAIACGPQASAAMLAHLFADVAAFTGAAEMHDDMAIVVACYRE